MNGNDVTEIQLMLAKVNGSSFTTRDYEVREELIDGMSEFAAQMTPEEFKQAIQLGERQFMTKEDFDYWKTQDIFAFGHHFGVEPEYGDSW